MYNGIGLQTARGSGTNGYVQRNLGAIRHHKDKVSQRFILSENLLWLYWSKPRSFLTPCQNSVAYNKSLRLFYSKVIFRWCKFNYIHDIIRPTARSVSQIMRSWNYHSLISAYTKSDADPRWYIWCFALQFEGVIFLPFQGSFQHFWGYEDFGKNLVISLIWTKTLGAKYIFLMIIYYREKWVWSYFSLVGFVWPLCLLSCREHCLFICCASFGM